MKRLFILLCYLFSTGFVVKGQTFHLTKLADGKDISLRGMAIVNDQVAWVSGSRGTVAKTVDGGAHWQWLTVKGYEEMDFRSVAAFSGQKAIIVNAGSPAVILLTVDGGTSWQKVFSYDVDQIFYNGIGFWNEKQGIVFGDPIDGQLQLLATEDGGKNWMNISDESHVEMQPGEVAFAASGTSIFTKDQGLVWIGTGGTQARLLFSYDYGKTWTSYRVPIEQGEATQGVFSLAVNGRNELIAVGGDYKNFKNNNNVIQLSANGVSWKAPKNRLSGYKSCVTYISDTFVVSTGSSGTDFSLDGGQTWKLLSDQAFHVAKASASGKWILLAGEGGAIYRMAAE